MKQTAVEWLIQDYFGSEEKCSPLFRNKIKQAKEMERQNLNTVHKIGMELREYEIFDWLKCQDYDFLVEEIIESK